MRDPECVRFLQWALPRLRMRWSGFRKVRAQVCKRIGRRTRALGLSEFSGYRAYLEQTPVEWSVLDALCRITISRFYRDRDVFDHLHGPVLDRLAEIAYGRQQTQLRAWSIGCASGEEPYTLAIGAKLLATPLLRSMKLTIIASDVDAALLARARLGCYRASSVRAIPRAWLTQAFDATEDGYCLKSQYRKPVEFVEQDIRTAMPDGEFDLILCRNLVFTYFDIDLQHEILARLLPKLRRHGALVIGKHESLPRQMDELAEWYPALRIYSRP